ncbi:MAG: terminase small subunit [Elusimicrobiota bacterium]
MELVPRSLKPRQRRFVAEYLQHPNATKAAMVAGYSRKTAYSQGQRLLKNVEIHKAVESALNEEDISAQKILRGLWSIADSNISDAYNPDGSLRSIQEMPERFSRALASYTTVGLFEGAGAARRQIGRTLNLRLHDKVRALELLGKHLKLWTEKFDHSVHEDAWQMLDRFNAAAKQAKGK